jgi:hypothetical protein
LSRLFIGEPTAFVVATAVSDAELELELIDGVAPPPHPATSTAALRTIPNVTLRIQVSSLKKNE